jgi:hypothetical protein
MKLHPFEQLARDVARDRRPKPVHRWLLMLLALLLFVPSYPAHAGDNLLGTITSAGADTTNQTTAVPFCPGLTAKLTVVCDASSFISTDTSTAVSSTNGVPLAASEKWQTSVTGMCQTGSPPGCTFVLNGKNCPVIRVISAAGSSNCKVFFRNGTE